MSTMPLAQPTAGRTPPAPMTREERKVIFASSLGTVFEWYNFYLYGSLAAIIAVHFFSGVNPTAAFIFALLAFAAGFAVRRLRRVGVWPSGRFGWAQVYVFNHYRHHGFVDFPSRHPP